METIIATLVGAAASLLVCIINNNNQNKRTLSEFNAHAIKTDALIAYKLDELTKRVDKHNNVVERTYGLEKEVAVLTKEKDVANHRIEDLEKAAGQ